MPPVAIQPEAPPLHIDDAGVIRVGDSRVSLDVIIESFSLGDSPETIACSYPTVTLAQVYATISYYLRHRVELNAYLEQGRRLADGIRTRIESQAGYVALRERLLNRAQGRGLIR